MYTSPTVVIRILWQNSLLRSTIRWYYIVIVMFLYQKSIYLSILLCLSVNIYLSIFLFLKFSLCLRLQRNVTMSVGAKNTLTVSHAAGYDPLVRYCYIYISQQEIYLSILLCQSVNIYLSIYLLLKCSLCLRLQPNEMSLCWLQQRISWLYPMLRATIRWYDIVIFIFLLQKSIYLFICVSLFILVYPSGCGSKIWNNFSIVFFQAN